jgi:hypothetical protein
MLVYGIDIGTPEAYGTLGPKPEGAEEWAPPDVDWIDDESRLTFADQLIITLAERSGWIRNTDDEEGGAYKASKFVEEHCGVRIVGHGCDGYQQHLLAPAGEQFKLTTGGDWDIRVVSATELLPPGMVEGGERLARALDALGLTTSRPPAWLLVADYG